jgi:hypothetical protein|tara:strand:+ start:147 stop:407 length:261 start_codon:yes stop_codon:yes gene_type:complete
LLGHKEKITLGESRMESQILFFSGVSIVGFFIIGMFAGWFLNDLIAAFLHQQRMPSHPEMYDENGNIIPDDILAVRFESPDDDDDD